MCIQKIKDWLDKILNPVDPQLPPDPEYIQYLVIKDGERAPVWPKVNGQVKLGDLKAGDAAVVRTKHMQGDQPWYEVLLLPFSRFAPVQIGWVKFKADKMYLEMRQVK